MLPTLKTIFAKMIQPRNLIVIVSLFISLLNITNLIAQTRGFVKGRQEAKDHVALVIGNSNYPDMPLKNPKNDANDVAKAFSDMGFIVEKVVDADKEKMGMAIERFKTKLGTAKAAVFYFAGHGMQVNGENYLIPIGNTPATQISTEEHVLYRAINAGEILAAMESQKVNFSLVVLDACRNNPIKGNSRGKIKGLATIDAPAGSLVMYATKAGSVADDGLGKNSPFTSAFLKHVSTPGLDVNLLPSKVTQTVQEITGGTQIPGSYVQLTQSFSFVPQLTEAEILALKLEKKKELSLLEKQQLEIAQKQQADDETMSRQQAELDTLDKQINALKNKTSEGPDSNTNLDKMLEIIETRKKQHEQLIILKKQAEKRRIEREKELAELKIKEEKENFKIFEADLKKYKTIAESDFGRDMKEAAWNQILSKWNVIEGSVNIGDEKALRKKCGLGIINITTEPVAVDIYINGKKNSTSPKSFNGLYGELLIELKKEGYKHITKKLNIEKGTTLDINETLIAGKYVSVSCSPPRFLDYMKIDGKYISYTETIQQDDYLSEDMHFQKIPDSIFLKYGKHTVNNIGFNLAKDSYSQLFDKETQKEELKLFEEEKSNPGRIEIIIPCADKGRSSADYFRAASVGASPNLNIAQNMAYTLTLQRLVSLMSSKKKSLDERYANEMDLGSADEFNQTFEDMTKDEIQIKSGLHHAVVTCKKITFHSETGVYECWMAVEFSKEKAYELFKKKLIK